jgi:arsenite oxidase small subunit
MIDDNDSTAGKRKVSRRTFCNELLLTSTGIVVGASIAGETAVAQESVLAYTPMKVEGAAKLIVGSSLYFEYPTRNDPAVLLRSSEGEYTAFSRKCSHAGCSVEFDDERRCLKCPCHQGVFDARIGYVMYGPPQRPLDQIVLQMRAGGEVWAIGKSIGKNADRIALEH